MADADDVAEILRLVIPFQVEIVITRDGAFTLNVRVGNINFSLTDFVWNIFGAVTGAGAGASIDSGACASIGGVTDAVISNVISMKIHSEADAIANCIQSERAKELFDSKNITVVRRGNDNTYDVLHNNSLVGKIVVQG